MHVWQSYVLQLGMVRDDILAHFEVIPITSFVILVTIVRRKESFRTSGVQISIPSRASVIQVRI